MSDDEQREAWAQFRFEVIAPLLDKTLDRIERSQIRQEILEKTYTTPDGRSWQISGRTLRAWLGRYKREELAGLENRRHKSLGQMKAISESVLAEAKELRESMRSRSIQDIKMHLKVTKGIDISKIASSTLNRHLNRVGATKEKDFSDRGRHQRFEKKHINRLWQSDCSDGIFLPDPTGLKVMRQTTLITFIDDCSRFCVHGQFYFSERLVDMLDCFRTALGARGCPTGIYTDNGPMYRAHDFAHICSALGSGLKHSTPGDPSGKGKQERHYLTIQSRFYTEAKKAGLTTLTELNEFFWGWLDECYHQVEHSEIKMTPLERWQMEEDALVKRVSAERIYQALQLRSRRKVDTKTALIRLNGKRYQTSRNLAGQRVQVRWPFDDEAAVNIWQRGAFVERAELFVPAEDIDYSKRREKKEEEEPKVLDSSKRFAAALIAKFRGEKPPQDTSRYGFLTEREFIYVVEQCLGTSASTVDAGLLSQSYKRLSPLDADFVQQSLRRAIASKGSHMHISFYIKCLEESKQKSR